MCSVDESDAGGDLELVKESVNVLRASCRKCDQKANVLLQGKFPYCRDCFIVHFKHKFFSTIGKSKRMKPDDSVLLAFSGSASTTALLHLMKCGQSEERRKKVFSSAKAIYIDEGVTVSLPPEDRILYLNKIKKIFSEYPFPAFFALFDIDDVHLFPVEKLEEIEATLMNKIDHKVHLLFSKLKDDTSKEDFLKRARRRLLVLLAKQLECNKIFTGESSDHMAVTILTDVALGRGGQIAADIGFCDDRSENVCILRPLRECSRKEITFYNIYNELEPVIVPKIGFMGNQFSSIRKLTESFITSLQVNFPSTVPTIFGSGNKLVSPASKEILTKCALCQGGLESSIGELSAAESIKISSLVSQLGPQGVDPDTFGPICQGGEPKGACGSGQGSCCKSDSSHANANGLVCYGCQLILGKVPKDSWSDYLLPTMMEEQALEKMREEIQDFLL